MGSICGGLVSNLLDVLQQMPEELPSRLISVISSYGVLKWKIRAVIVELRFVMLFEDCIHKWSNAHVVVPDSTARVGTTAQEIAKQVENGDVQNFRKQIKKIKETRLKQLTKFQKSASKMLDVLTHLDEKMNLLKAEVGEACQILLDQSFLCYSPRHDFDGWSSFVSSIYPCLWELQGKSNHEKKAAEKFGKNLLNLLYFLNGLPEIPTVEDFFIDAANMAIRAAFVSCQWWANQFDPSMEEVVHVALSHLEKMTNVTNPEYLDQIFKLLKSLKTANFHSTERKVEILVQDLLPFRRRFEAFIGKCFLSNKHLLHFTLVEKIYSLIILVLQIPGGEAENEQSLLLDIKLLILDIDSFSCSSLENGTLLHKFLAKIRLLNIEVFLLLEKLPRNILLFVKEEVKAFKEGLQRAKFSQVEQTEIVNQIMTLMEGVSKLVVSVPRCSRANEMLRTLLLLLLLKILLFELDSKLHDCNESLMLSLKYRIQALLEGLKFLINACIKPQREIREMLNVGEVARIEPIVRSVISLCRSLLTHGCAEKMIENVNPKLSHLLDKIKLIMANLKEVFLPGSKSNFPKTNALGFYDSLLSKIQELMRDNANLFVSIKQHIEEILANLQFFRHFLGNIPGLEKENQELRNLWGHVINVAYEAEDLIDSLVYGIQTEWHILIWLYGLLQDIRHVRMQVTKVHEEKTYDIKVHNVPQTSSHMVSKATTPRIDDFVLSLNDQQELIIDKLVGGYSQRDTVSIVGMPGIGKTTLAKKVYGSTIVAYHFHIRAWCCVTAVYKKRELLLEILSHIILLTDNIRGMSTEDLDFKLHQLLLKKKYLIVMDDMWSTEAWDDLQTSFPNDENGSRILITSRLNDVALKAKAHSDAHHLRLLSDAESWALLQMKIFGKECCPVELIEVGQEIAKSCKGLPLAIAAISGILERTERQGNQWKEIARNLSSRIVDDPQEQCCGILELSYKFLPDYLKACFLYFGAFLEDREIPVTKLIRFWIAEGFIQKSCLKSMEDLAEDYLKDLIGRSLVIFAQPRSRGGAKACRVHDMLRNFCHSKAKEENFLKVITMPNESYASFDDVDFLVDDNFNKLSFYKMYEDHRLCFYLKRNHFIKSRSSGRLVRSLLFFGTNDRYARSSYDISFISKNFRRLKVLDLECINIGPSFPCGMEQMMELRYLAVSGDVDSVPSSIAKISNLETFVVKGLKGTVNLPDAIWSLKRLRHFHVTDVAVISLKYSALFNSCVLDYLVTLSSLLLRNGEGMNNMLRKFPNLRKLGCILLGSPDCSSAYNHCPRLDVLTRLESLKISYYGGAPNAAQFCFPLCLKKLTLSNFRLPWSEISAIGRLQNLEVLKLLSRAYNGEIWDMVEGEFNNLKLLKLDTLKIVKWIASSNNLPKLEKLVLRNCKLLEEVPSSFMEISTLQMIEVQWCGKSAEESVRRMRDEADELLKVIITSDVDSRSL